MKNISFNEYLDNLDDSLRHYIGQFQDEDDGNEYSLYYYVGRYGNGRIALDIDFKETDGYYGPYARATVNLPDMNIPENLFSDSCGTDEHQEHAFINGDLTEKFKQWLRDKNIISYPLRTVKYNYGTYELCEILVK